MPQLFDASSLTNLIVRKGGEALYLLKNNYVLDLTFYEVGNALWRMHVLIKKLSASDVEALMDVMADLVGWVNMVSVSDLDIVEVMKLAADKSITFYDAAYVAAAKLKKLALITDDSKLTKVASKLVKVKNSRELGA